MSSHNPRMAYHQASGHHAYAHAGAQSPSSMSTRPTAPHYSSHHHTASSSSSGTLGHTHAHANANANANAHGHGHGHERSSSSSQYWDTVLDPTPSPARRASDAAVDGASRAARAGVMSPTSTGRECPSCRRVLGSTRAFEEHLRQCSPLIEKPYVCDECGTAFKKNSNLVKHMKLVHLGERNFACPESGCGRLFGQKSNLNSHIKAVHLGEKPFVCPEPACGRRFSQKSGLKAHIKTVHNGERPYVCDCGSSFGHRGDLNRHIRVLHERQRPFECSMCPEPRAFGRKSVLMRHMRTHSQGGGDVRSSRSDSS